MTGSNGQSEPAVYAEPEEPPCRKAAELERRHREAIRILRTYGDGGAKAALRMLVEGR